ncbi:hypothetical protein HU200_052844 [Digitaria exilis]|uniref:No apical meristem-associated C-terminal domain-containing protein n=1 Tax=Digitaria exilis TaxID=1010633 RepID=A0A835ASW2_9POAL|nr:hypothetical protein HU200_052844 [Digitaria exilis]
MAPLPLHATGFTTPLPDVVARDLGDGVPPPVGQPGWWSGSLPQVTPRGTMSPNCGMDYYPPGGFMSYFQAGQQPFPPLHVPISAPWPPVSKEFQHAPPSSDLSAQPDEARSKGKTKQTRKKGGKTIINIDDGNDVRTAKRLVFEPDEDLRLFYLDDYKEGPFTVLHCWKVLRDEPKWLAILEDQDKSNKMSADDESNKRSLDDGDQLRDISEKERPMGTKEAKKQRNGKGGVKNVDAGLHEELKKYMDIQAGAKQRHEDFIETQRRISSEKVEAAKLRREAALLESYQKLMSMDTKEMTEDMRAEHAIGLKFIREKLVGNTN